VLLLSRVDLICVLFLDGLELIMDGMEWESVHLVSGLAGIFDLLSHGREALCPPAFRVRAWFREWDTDLHGGGDRLGKVMGCFLEFLF